MLDWFNSALSWVPYIAGLGTIGIVLLVVFGVTSIGAILNAIASIITNLMPSIGIAATTAVEGIRWYVTEFWGDAQMLMHNLSIVVTILAPLWFYGVYYGHSWATQKHEAVISDLHENYTVIKKKTPNRKKEIVISPITKKPTKSSYGFFGSNIKVPTLKPITPKNTAKGPSYQDVLSGATYLP